MSIWTYAQNLEPIVPQPFQLTLNEGNTPCQECKNLATELNVNSIFIKREDLNPTGSFKDRSLAFQLSHYAEDGKSKFALSSSGNAAISAIAFCLKFNCELNVFLSRHIPLDKLMRVLETAKIRNLDPIKISSNAISTVNSENIRLHFSDMPRRHLFQYLKESETVNLQGSKDDHAITGFMTISFELAKQAPDADAIFIPCSSGTSTIGIYEGYQCLKLKMPQLHIVQTTKVQPIAKMFDTHYHKTATSIATAISDRVAHRKDRVVESVQKSRGGGWIINNDEIYHAQTLLKRHCNITASKDASLSLAGLVKALKFNCKITKPVLILSSV